MLPRPHTVLFACAAFLSAAAGRAQCTTQWRAGEGVPGTDNWVATTHLWDPDGSGPANELLVVGGAFAIAGDRRVANLATYDLATGTFADLGGGCDGDVTHLAVLPTGELVVAGRFQHAGGVPAPGIARWDGTQWTAVGTVAVDVLAMTVDAGGDLVVAGLLPGFGYNPAVARWNASGWQLLGGPFTGNPNLPVSIRAIAALPNGDLAVGGCFSSAGSTPANRVARWNGSAWQALGNLGGTQVLGLKVAANGDLLACATIGYPNGGPSFVGRHHNGAWTQVGPVANDTIVDLVEMGNGDLVTTGRFTSFGATPAHYVARWDGTGWSQFGGVSPVAFGACLCVLPAGELIAAGWGGGNLARWNGQAWSALCDGIGSSLTASPRVNCVAAHRDVVAIAGTFTKIGSVEAFSIAMHRDGDWHPLGTGILGIPRALAILPNGDVVVGGSILEAGGQACSNLARWDGTAWRTFGSGANGWVNALAVLPDGDLVAAGVFSLIDGTPCSGVARWDGTHWWPLGSGFYDVTSLAVTETGTLLLGARFANPAAPSFVGVAQWTGSSWARQGVISMPGPPRVLAMPGGEIYATGIDFSPQPFLWRWNGSI